MKVHDRVAVMWEKDRTASRGTSMPKEAEGAKVRQPAGSRNQLSTCAMGTGQDPRPDTPMWFMPSHRPGPQFAYCRP
jgi:hypothetical protein